jgi:uncharacterized damage-inducible protein DinB
MTICQTLTLDYEDEIKNTRKLLERVPMDDAHRNYQPHAKSMEMARLATHVAELPGWMKFALESELLELPLDFKPTIAASSEELMAMFDKAVEEGRAALAAATDEDMAKNWTFKFGDIFSMTEPRPKVVRSFLNHQIHHRAQLGVYLRLNDIAVPGMYGPSADEH